MNDKRFDDIVAEKLNSYGSEVPADMWERIHQPRKRRRLFMWWWTGGGIAAGIAIFYFLITGNHSSEIIADQQKSTNVQQKPTTRVDHPSEARKTTVARKSVPEKIVNPRFNNPKSQIAHTDEKVEPYQRPANKESNDNLDDEQHSFLYTQSDNDFLQFNKPGDQKYDLKRFISIHSSLNKTFNNPCNPIKQKLQPWFAELFIGPAKGFKNAETGLYPLLPDETQHTELSWQSGIMVGKYIGNRWTLKSGILYTSINIDSRLINDSIRSVGNNVKRILDIPVIAGYQLGSGKLKASLNAGVLVNVLTNYINPDDPSLRKNVGLKSYSSVSGLYPLGEKLKLYIEPYYIHQFRNMSRNGYIKLRLHQAGLSLGIRYTIDTRQHY